MRHRLGLFCSSLLAATALLALTAHAADNCTPIKRAFGSPPARVVGVGVMTDSDNTGTKASGDYANLRFSCRTE